MLRKIAILIILGIFSLSIAGCPHLKKPPNPFKHKHGKKSELRLNTDVNSYAEYIKNMQEVEG